VRIVMAVARADEDAAAAALGASGMRVKNAVVQLRLGVDAARAEEMLETHGGSLRRALS
jgi:N-acetylmuramic acid 6-phosphate (MurNAc-6-P) etherase